MALEPIGDIANPTLQNNADIVLTWETAADWDNAVSEAGVIHEDVGDNVADVIAKGYPTGDADRVLYIHGDEDSGTTLADVSGNGNDATLNGGIVGNTGILGTTSPAYDGSDDYAESPDDASLNFSGDISFACWFHRDATTRNNPRLLQKGNSNNQYGFFAAEGTGSTELKARLSLGGSDTLFESGLTYSTGAWHFAGFSWDESAGTMLFYLDGSTATASASGSLDTSTDALALARRPDGNSSTYFDGRIEVPMLWTNEQTTSNFDALYNAGPNGTSTLTTATKSFASAQTPDLDNLSYALNGESMSIDVIGSPGTASEEIVSQTLDGSTSYTLTWSNSHTDFRLKFNLDTSVVTATPTMSATTLVA